VLRCPPCVGHRTLGNQFISRKFYPVFAPFGQSADLYYLVNYPVQDIHKLKHVRKELLDAKRKIARQMATEVINSNAITVTGHRAYDLMSVLNIVHKAVESELIEDSTTEGTSEEKENKFKMRKVLFRRLIEVYRNGDRIRGFLFCLSS
jgi:hypothetical protein